MKTYGYARVSTKDQKLEIQLEALREAGCHVVRSESVSGRSMDNREQLKTILDFIQPGDELVVTRIDRLARSIADLSKIISILQSKNVTLRVTEQPIDTSTAMGTMFIQQLGIFAEFENTIRRERQAEGILKAKEKGVYTGRQSTIDGDLVRKLITDGYTPTQIGRKLKISRQSVYRLAS